MKICLIFSSRAKAIWGIKNLAQKYIPKMIFADLQMFFAIEKFIRKQTFSCLRMNYSSFIDKLARISHRTAEKKPFCDITILATKSYKQNGGNITAAYSDKRLASLDSLLFSEIKKGLLRG